MLDVAAEGPPELAPLSQTRCPGVGRGQRVVRRRGRAAQATRDHACEDPRQSGDLQPRPASGRCGRPIHEGALHGGHGGGGPAQHEHVALGDGLPHIIKLTPLTHGPSSVTLHPPGDRSRLWAGGGLRQAIEAMWSISADHDQPEGPSSGSRS